MEPIDEILRLVLGIILGGGATYWWGRRGKIDEIRIRRVHDLVEQLSIAFQDVSRGMDSLRSWYESNFKHLDSIAQAMSYFRDGADALYASKTAALEQLTKDKANLALLVKQAQVYLPESLLNDLTSYIETCKFEFSSAWPLFDTWLESFFQNLLDPAKHTARTGLEKKIMKGLREVQL